MGEHPEEFDLSDGGLPDELVIFGLLKLLDGHQRVVLGVATPHHHTVGALPDHSEHFILLHTNIEFPIRKVPLFRIFSPIIYAR